MLQLNHDLACHVFMGLFSERKYLRAHNKTGQTSSQGKKKKINLRKIFQAKVSSAMGYQSFTLIIKSKIKNREFNSSSKVKIKKREFIAFYCSQYKLGYRLLSAWVLFSYYSEKVFNFVMLFIYSFIYLLHVFSRTEQQESVALATPRSWVQFPGNA